MSDNIQRIIADLSRRQTALRRRLERVGANEERRTQYCCAISNTGQTVNPATITLATFTAGGVLLDVGWVGNATAGGGMLTTPAALTGTVTKVIGGTTLAGVGTAFLTELYEGAVIVVGTEYNVVTSIVSNVLINVNLAWAAAGAGIGASKSINGASIPATGYYALYSLVKWDLAAVAGRNMQNRIHLNRNLFMSEVRRSTTAFGDGVRYTSIPVTIGILCQKYDLIQVYLRHSSAGDAARVADVYLSINREG